MNYIARLRRQNHVLCVAARLMMEKVQCEGEAGGEARVRCVCGSKFVPVPVCPRLAIFSRSNSRVADDFSVIHC